MPQANTHPSIARLLDGYRAAVERHAAAARNMAAAGRLFRRISGRTKMGDAHAYELAGVPMADLRSIRAYRACDEALEQMHAAVALQEPAGVLTPDRVIVWATAMGRHLSCTLSDFHADIANSNRLAAAQARVRARETEIAND